MLLLEADVTAYLGEKILYSIIRTFTSPSPKRKVSKKTHHQEMMIGSSSSSRGNHLFCHHHHLHHSARYGRSLGTSIMKHPKTLIASRRRMGAFVPIALIAIASHPPHHVHSFAPISPAARGVQSATCRPAATATPTRGIRDSIQKRPSATVILYAAEEDAEDTSPSLSDSESLPLGVAGLLASAIAIYSESVLFRTGCGLPAGPLGLVGAAEGVSYLGVVGLVGYSLYTKMSTVSWKLLSSSRRDT